MASQVSLGDVPPGGSLVYFAQNYLLGQTYTNIPYIHVIGFTHAMEAKYTCCHGNNCVIVWIKLDMYTLYLLLQ